MPYSVVKTRTWDATGEQEKSTVLQSVSEETARLFLQVLWDNDHGQDVWECEEHGKKVIVICYDVFCSVYRMVED